MTYEISSLPQVCVKSILFKSASLDGSGPHLLPWTIPVRQSRTRFRWGGSSEGDCGFKSTCVSHLPRLCWLRSCTANAVQDGY